MRIASMRTPRSPHISSSIARVQRRCPGPARHPPSLRGGVACHSANGVPAVGLAASAPAAWHSLDAPLLWQVCAARIPRSHAGRCPPQHQDTSPLHLPDHPSQGSEDEASEPGSPAAGLSPSWRVGEGLAEPTLAGRWDMPAVGESPLLHCSQLCAQLLDLLRRCYCSAMDPSPGTCS